MSTVSISEEEYLRLKRAAGEIDTPTLTNCYEVGHVWKQIGGANAGCSDECVCSRPVYECLNCKCCDYGENQEGNDIVSECSEREEIEYQKSLEAEQVLVD